MGRLLGGVFALNTDDSTFTTVYSIDGTDGCAVTAGLILSGNALFGTAQDCGGSGSGTVFKVNTDGTGFTALHRFSATNPNNGANSDGAYPQAGLVLSGTTLYGTTWGGGRSGNGVVFEVNTNGAGFRTLHSFTTNRANSSGAYTNSDGVSPYGGILVAGNTLYGTANGGGNSGFGTVFKLNTDGTGFTTLHNFAAPTGQNPDNYPINSDGASPYGGLILSDDALYGTTGFGGSSGNGTVFAVNTDGTSFKTLYSFSGGSTNASGIHTNSDGAHPLARLILVGDTLYGTASGGGGAGKGTVFSLTVPASPPKLTITPFGASVVLTWPSDATGFTLQSAPVISSTFTNIPGATSPYTNAITGAQQYFRLASP